MHAEAAHALALHRTFAVLCAGTLQASIMPVGTHGRFQVCLDVICRGDRCYCGVELGLMLRLRSEKAKESYGGATSQQ